MVHCARKAIPTPPTESGPNRAVVKLGGKQAGRLCVLALLPLHLLVGVTASDYAGAASCAKCHPTQFTAQSSSAHARALAPSKPGQPGLWAFGAGVQAITFVSRLDADTYVELDQTWYRKL